MTETRWQIPLNSMSHVLIMLTLLVTCVANAEPLELLDSVNFAFSYEQDQLSSSEDLDGNGNVDFYANNAGELPVISNGIASFDSGDFYRTDFTNSIWRANFPQDVDYTIEARLQITETDPANEGTLGIMGIFVRDMGDNSCTIAYVGMNRVQVNDGGTVLELDTSDNTDGYHIFRVARNAEGFWVWRDNVLLNPDRNTAFSEPTIGGGKGHFLGDTSGTGNNGSWDLDWVRIDNTGAYGPESRVASQPSPKNRKDDVPRDVILSWKPGDYAVTHDVYFDATFDDVSNADRVNPLGVQLAQAQDANSIDAGRVEFGKTYYWRVDEVNGTPDKTVFKGDVWSFTAEPYSIPIPADQITATASSSSNEFSTPDKTIDGSGLGANDMHAITPETMWFSAAVDLDPWIQYEFDTFRQLDTMKAWNANSAAEMAIGWGIKDVRIEYSVDGETWDVLEDANQLSRAPGSPTYDQYDEIAFNGVAAKYVRLGIQSNWGGILMSYGLSEVKFSMIPAQARTPVPASGSEDVLPDAIVTWRSGRNAAEHIIYMSTDSNAVAEGSAPSVTSNTDSLDLSLFDLQLGETYTWRVDEVNDADATTLWAGPVWSFSTVDLLIVDDFESYGNFSPDRPFQTWLDGFGYSADEFFPVPYEGNGTGSGVGHDIWSLSSPHYNGKIMETTYTIPGSGQSMPFYYSNTGSVASQTERTFAEPQDWTVGGAKTLAIAFRGQPGNTGTLYIKINDTQLTYPHAAGDIALGAWQAWNIDLSSLDVQDVTKLQIGVEGVAAKGLLYIDDIRLYAEAGEMITPVSPGNDNLVGAWDFDEGTGTVAADSSGNGRHGTLVDATWESGKQGSAVSFNGMTGYVNIDGYKGINADRSDPDNPVQKAFTVAGWINTEADGALVTWGSSDSSGVGGQYQSFRIDGGSLRAEHGNGNYRGATPVSDGEWHHVALTVADGANLQPPQNQLYVDGVKDSLLASGNSQNIYNLTEDTDVSIGRRASHNDRFFTGLIDQVRIYDRALSLEEVLWLAGRTSPIAKPF